MKLTQVRIRGFRSIEDAEITFDGYGHKILVGINESGKSNILKALKVLQDGTFKKSDGKEGFEDAGGKAAVCFKFSLEKNELDQYWEEFIQKFYVAGDNKGQASLTNQHTIESFFMSYAQIYLRFNINERHSWDWRVIPEEVKIKKEWHYMEHEESEFGFSQDTYIHDSFIEEKLNIPEETKNALKQELPPVTLEHVGSSMLDIIIKIVTLSKPPIPCIYWEYGSGNYDLLNEVNIESFLHNPESCLPLQRIFELTQSKTENIYRRFSKTKALGHNPIKNLLDRINRAINKYIRDNWKMYNKEYENVKIELRDCGDNIAIGVQDSEKSYNFAQRSDGFRRFVSLLLQMSNTRNSLILLDEPETSMHPSSARDLRDLLIALGKDNFVVYATHSPSMVDIDNIENNLIVEKEDENTKIKTEYESKISSAEVVYQAMGHSIYHDLKKKNVLVEGRTDKKLLKQYMQGEEWNEFGICVIDGVDNIKCVVPILELAERQYVVLSDADAHAEKKRKKCNIHPWYIYKDLRSGAITIEDFYTKEFFEKIAKNAFRENKIKTDDFPFSEMGDNNRVYFVKSTLQKRDEDEEVIKKVMSDIKNNCADTAEKTDMDDDKVKEMLSALLKRIT